jgi:hypothetical protein
MSDQTHLPERWPAALRLDQAAQYSGLSVDVFKKVCPVKPIGFTDSARGNRYLRMRLDEWLVSLDPNEPNYSPTPKRRIGERIGG